MSFLTVRGRLPATFGPLAQWKTATQRPPFDRLADWWSRLVQVGVLAATRDDVIDGSSDFLRRHVFCATLSGHSA